MRIFIALLAVVGLVAAASLPAKETKFADKEFLERQKFLFEIVYRVEDPPMFEEYIKLGKSFHFNKDEYLLPENHVFMTDYYKAYKHGVTLPKGEFFGVMLSSHYEQLHGLFEFFYYAKNWEIFQRNVCWARLHANEAMFVHALTLAVLHRDDFQGLMLPTIYEIFPQYFFNSKFIYEAEKFDYDTWSKYIMYEKEYKDIMYTDYTKYFKEFDNYNYYYTKDFKTWQWWKLMGLGEHWYSVDHSMIRDNVQHYKKDAKYLDMIKDVKMFWMPVDYTRDIEFFNQESELSYFTEDVEWNSFWYYFNMNFAPFLDGESFGLAKYRRGELFMYAIRQILARYYMERLSNGYGEIPEFSLKSEIEYGYNPQLINYNGVGFSYRKNYYEIENQSNMEYINTVRRFFKRIEDIIATGHYTFADGKTIDMRKPESIEYLGDLMQGNVDVHDKYLSTFWYMLGHMFVAGVKDETYVMPNVWLNYETMLRDPLFYVAYKKIANVFYHFHHYIQPYTQEELLFPGVQIKDVKVSELVTYFDLVDFDVTNLLNDKMTFVDGQFVWDKTLLARQMRLNHKPFDFDFTIQSDKAQSVYIRIFMAPKYDEFGRVLSLTENRENFLKINGFTYDLQAGVNNFKLNSNDFYWFTDDRTTYTELYKQVMLAYEGKYELPMNFAEHKCGMPDRLMLPRGWEKGMPMQFFFLVTPHTGSQQRQSLGYNFGCGVGSVDIFIDDLPLGYPFDRQIDEFDFFVPNMYMKDVKIYHEHTVRNYYGEKYEKFGTFDDSFYYHL